MWRAHIVLQDLQAVAMMLHRMAFHLSLKVVALHLDNSMAKAYLCKEGCTVSPFLFRVACWILSLTNKHGITLIPAYIPTYLNVEANYLSQDQMLPEWHLLPQAAFNLWCLPEVDLLAPSHSTQCQHYYSFGISTTSGGPWGWMPSTIHGMFQVGYMFSPPALVPLVLSQVSGRTCQRSTQTVDSGGTILDGGSLAPHSSQHVGRDSLVVPWHKRSHHGCLIRSGAQGSAISAYNPLAAQWCVLCRQGFSSLVCQELVWATQASMSKVY